MCTYFEPVGHPARGVAQASGRRAPKMPSTRLRCLHVMIVVMVDVMIVMNVMMMNVMMVVVLLG